MFTTYESQQLMLEHCKKTSNLHWLSNFAIDLEIDILAIQEIHRTSSGFYVLDDDSLNGWQWILSGL